LPEVTLKISRFRWGLFLVTLVLLAVGVAFIHSASYKISSGDYEGYAARQVQWVGLGLVLFVGLLFVSYRTIGKLSPFIYLAGLGGLGAVFILGVAVHGSKRWIPVGSIRVQPSEFMKLAVIVTLARYCVASQKLRQLRGLLVPGLLVLLPVGLIAMQPDMGTALVMVPIFFSVTYVGGARVRYLLLLVLIGLALAPVMWFCVLRDYQKGRLLAFISPESSEYRLSEGYHLIQSKVAIGSGGLTGKGWGRGTQNTHGALPERHTDFVFSVVGEEWGFAGCVFVLGLLFGIMLLCLDVAYSTNDPFGRLLVVGVCTMFFVQTFVNVGMTIGLMPITGLTLPLVSFGGSSLMTSMAGLSLVVNVAMRRVQGLPHELAGA
jgi:rod shape determining protein RodA